MSAAEQHTFLYEGIEEVRDDFQKLYEHEEKGITEDVLESERNIYDFIESQELPPETLADVGKALYDFNIKEAYNTLEEEMQRYD